MVTTCFFCQNLLSDYIEGILPSLRHEELKRHIDHCKECKEVHHDLLSTLNALHSVKTEDLTRDLAVRIVEVSEKKKKQGMRRLELSRTVFMVAVPLVLFITSMVVFPRFFPWMTYLRGIQDESQFVRYFPLLQGASELIDEHTTWFGQKSPFAGSLWEEGGLSPDEFEKAFQKKGSKGSEKGSENENSDSPNQP